MDRDIGKRKEKIESKGAYSYDVHKAIRDVQDAFKRGDIRKTATCLEVLRDICPPEIREAVNGEWIEIDKKYHNELERVKNAGFKVGSSLGSGKTGWVGNTYYTADKVHAPESTKRGIAESRRSEMLRKIWVEILHEKFRACIDCLDRHGELRKWREVEYGKI